MSDLQVAVFRPKRIIGEFQNHVTVEERETDSLEKTEHPVQRGANVSDHAVVNPRMIDISLAVSSKQDLRARKRDFVNLIRNRVLIDIETGKDSYTNMICKSLENITDQTKEHALSLQLSFEEFILVEVQAVFVAPRDRHTNPELTADERKTGKRQAVPDSSVDQSDLERLL